MNSAEAQGFPPEPWAFVIRQVDHDAYLLYTGGEISLVNTSTLTRLIGNLLKGTNHDER